MIYDRLIKPLLYALPIEQAHHLVLFLLRAIGKIPGGRWLLRKRYAVADPTLEREVYGLRFANPVGLAAGFDVNGDCYEELAAMGFGFIEIGTLTPKPQEGNPRPRVFRLNRDRAMVNRMGHPNRGLEYAINRLRHGHKEVVVGCNIGSNRETMPDKAWKDYLKLFRNLYQYVDYFTVNIECDNSSIGGEAPTDERLMQILEPLFDFRRGQNQYRPILLKVSPDLSDADIDRMADVMISTPLDGIVAVSGTTDRLGLETSVGSLAKVGTGRLSGAPLLERSLQVVQRIHARARGTYPIIGVGGVMSAEDARRMLEAGASLVQVYSGFIYEGPRFAGEICRQMLPQPEPEPQPEQPSESEPQSLVAPNPMEESHGDSDSRE